MKNNLDFIDTCIWASARYFIGRKTIAAAQHAADIANYINEHKSKFNQVRLQFYAKDIRDCISHHIGFENNVHVEGYSDKIDAFSLMCFWLDDYLKQNPDKILNFSSQNLDSDKYFQPNNYIWYVDLSKQTVDVEINSNKSGYPMNWDETVVDLVPWIKLAGFLDKTHHLQIEYPKGTIQEVDAFAFPICGRFTDSPNLQFYIGYCDDRQYLKHTLGDTYFNNEVIKSIQVKWNTIY